MITYQPERRPEACIQEAVRLLNENKPIAPFRFKDPLYWEVWYHMARGLRFPEAVHELDSNKIYRSDETADPLYESRMENREKQLNRIASC